MNVFYKNYPKKLIGFFLAIKTALPMAKPIIKFIKLIKQKQEQLANSTNKQARKS